MHKAIIKNIVIIGAGNVATNIAFACKKQFNILQIFSKTAKSTKILGEKLRTNYTHKHTEINNSADLYIISISDDAISEILKTEIFQNKFVVHTSGSVSIDVFKNHVNNYGVIYPLQTFSKNRIISFENIPLCIEANTKENENILADFANKLSKNVRFINSIQRQILHISAVFSCNFTNHMYSISEKLLMENNMNFNIIKPLIKETCEKALANRPFESQTGPAIRNDNKIIEKHLEALKKDADLYEIYLKLSNHIKKLHNING